MAPINATPMKVYIFLFLFVIIGYAAFIITKSLKRSSNDMEHFVEEHPNYKYRLEVMKVFDMYMNRNPTPEEIDKYAEMKNEQDILLTILKDFNITVSDINKDKLAKYKVVEEEEKFEGDAGQQVVEAEEEEVDVADVALPSVDIEKMVNDARKDVGIIDTWKEDVGESIQLSRKAYDDLKTRISDLHAAVLAYDQAKTPAPLR